MNVPMLRSLRIPLLLLVGLPVAACPGSCQSSVTSLRTELEDLREMKSRLLIDLPAGPFGKCRFVYVEKRGSCETGGNDPLLLPQRWTLGMADPLVTVGPVFLHGLLAQLYNPLAHGPGSEVFTGSADLSLDIDLEVGSRKGVQLKVVPGHWSLLCTFKERTGAQFGSAIAVPFGNSFDCTMAGLLSAPPGRLEQEQSWYGQRPLFPGGLVSVLAGSLTWEHRPLRLFLAAAASAGQRVSPGAFFTLGMNLSAAPGDLALLLGYCSPGYFTPEGDKGDLEWIAAARATRDIGIVHLSAGLSRELNPLPPFPRGFRGGCDHLTAGIRIVSGSAARRLWSIDGDAEIRREWSEEGNEHAFACVQIGSTMDWGRWNAAGKASLQWGGDTGGIPAVLIVFIWDPGWGKIELGAGYRHGPRPGFDLTAAVEAKGEDKRLYFHLASKDPMSPNIRCSSWNAEDWLKLFSIRLGWEASFRRRPPRNSGRRLSSAGTQDP
jgi:hypothetical protein